VAIISDMYNRIINFVTKKNSIYPYIIAGIFVILIGFNGYVNPFNLRSFGDISPNYVVLDESIPFQYFGVNYQSRLIPNFHAPYSYQLENLRYNFESNTNLSIYTIDWLVYFLPFLISVFLALLFFLKISKHYMIGWMVWFFYTFSTFVLFTSSIHTPIITAINFFLFFLYLTLIWLNNKPSQKSNILYILSSSVVLMIASIQDLRMLIVTMPAFLIIGISLIYKTRSEQKNKNKVSNSSILFNFGSIIFILILNFSFLVINIQFIKGGINNTISRQTWGSGFFQVMNVLSLSHPFWNNGQAKNFIYNSPSIIHQLNIVLFIITGWFAFVKGQISTFIIYYPSFLPTSF